MTKKKDLKKRVREQQEKTGESYTAALAHLRAPRDIPQMPDASAEARAEGLRCTAVVSEALRATGDLRPLFARLREMLQALDAAACGVLLRGEMAPRRMPGLRALVEARRFLAQVRAGARGMSRDERTFALAFGGRVVVGSIAIFPKAPLLQLGFLEDAEKAFAPELSLAGIGR